MKKFIIFLIVSLSCTNSLLQAQDLLPQEFSVSLGGGLTLPYVDGNRNDFFNKNGNRAGYNLTTEGFLFNRGYCGLSIGMGYEFYISKKISGVFRADILTADWFANPDARLYNPDDYDDGIDHSWFKNNITFFNIGFAIQFGR